MRICKSRQNVKKLQNMVESGEKLQNMVESGENGQNW